MLSNVKRVEDWFKFLWPSQKLNQIFLLFSDAKELLNSNEEIAFVLEEFEGPVYDYLHSLKKTIFGPTLVQQLAARGLPPQPCERPLFNLSMEGVGICFNQTSKKFKSEIKKYFSWIQSMGGKTTFDNYIILIFFFDLYSRSFEWLSTFLLNFAYGHQDILTIFLYLFIWTDRILFTTNNFRS